MKNKENRPPRSISSAGAWQTLRQRAETIAREKECRSSNMIDAMSLEETRQKLHELLVHQIELEMQNDELRRAQAELEDARVRYMDLYDLAPMGYCTISEKGLILEANLTAAGLLGMARCALVNQPVSRFIHKEDQDIYYLHKRQLFSTGEPQVCELRMVKRGGEAFWAHFNAITLEGADGMPVCRVALSDINDRKLKDEELKAIEEALRQSEQRALALVEELRKADQNKNEFISMLSHELRNPLSTIMVGVSLLEFTLDAEKTRATTEIMKRQSVQLCRLVDDLLDLTRINMNKVKLKKERTELCKLVRAVADDFAAQFEEKGVRLETKIASDALFLEADAARLTQIIGNLLHNAAKFTKAGGATLLTVNRQEKQAVICVEDNGIGIRPETLPDLFQPFVQLDDSIDRSNGGLGLGLAIVKGMAELHGGSVSAFSAGLGKGTRFTVLLPLFAEEEKEQGEKRSGGRPSRSFRILCIDDNADFADILCSMLEQWGHITAVASNGITGIAKAKEFCPDILFCDIGLPGMNGYEVAKSIKSDPSLANIFMVALTGYAGPRDTELALNSGFHRHIPKPIDINTLERILAEASWKQDIRS